MRKYKQFLIGVLVSAIIFGAFLFVYNLGKESGHRDSSNDSEEYEVVDSAAAVVDEYIIEETVEEPEPEYIDNGNVLYYLKSGTSLEDDSKILMCYIDGDYNLKVNTETKEKTTQNLIESEDYWDNYFESKGEKFEYDTSESSKTIYSASWDGESYIDQSTPPNVHVNMMTGTIDYGNIWDNVRVITPHYGTYYISISDDRSTVIRWKVRTDSSEKIEKEHYTRVKKGELMPQGINDDFMYE